MLKLNLSGKKFIITGATSGIGQCIAVKLAEEEANLVLLGRSEERLKETVAKLPGNGHEYYIADLSQQQDYTVLLNNITAESKLDGLVHSAGLGPITPLKLMKRSVIDEVMAVNVYSFLELVRAAANKKYCNQGSSIVAISSIAAVQPEKCQTVYSMSKAALNAAVQALAYELAVKQIRINSIMPGMCNTNMVHHAAESTGNDYLSTVLERQLLGILEAESIADICMFLLSDVSKAVTGRALYADGGRL